MDHGRILIVLHPPIRFSAKVQHRVLYQSRQQVDIADLDHFSNLLNEPAGRVAACILQYVAPRIVYAWEHPGVPVEQGEH